MSDQVFEIILGMILKLELKPRSHISEAQLAKDLGVSRTPVREAFQKLEALGFLDIVPQRGSTVAPIRVSAFRRSQFMREAFELALVRRATELEDNTALCSAIQREIKLQEVLSEIGDEAAFFQSDEAFHAAIAEHCGLGDVWPEVLRVKLYMDRFRYAVYSQRDTRAILVQHKEVAEAICARDTDAALKAMTRHLRRANHMLEEAVRTDPQTFEKDV
ncbi:DNA-binding transcriptional regulator, GntR family [Jannaschia seohaensis]|uniref:DNA-binding GntR family transcriptional regulator n=2 Tax=Jannaschia seohaensis TaxID=475081 RepID=A0A2Y9B440_9RHOB|nr:DNA-binding GntR family transcriptional regulator [Jannaschia seohaensis]SSA51270.1 DNA-binding transcriptional regulator, GntR family [Jannaschia seohaensis]